MLDHLNQIDTGVKQGTITGGGMLALPITGEAILFDVDMHVNNGNTFLSFFLTTPGASDYRRFQIRAPGPQDKQAAQYLGMKRIYATLHGAIKANPDSVLVTKAWEDLTTILKTHSLKVAFTCEERSFISQRDGKDVKTTDLLSLTGVAKIERVAMAVQKQSEKQTATPSAAGWGSGSESSFTTSNDIPF